MDLASALVEVGGGRGADSFSALQQHLDFEWITQALHSSGVATVRRRRLPAEFVIWLVIGMALFADRSINAVARHLDLVLPGGPRRRKPVSSSALVQARDRVAIRPLAELFTISAAHWAAQSAAALRWRGLAVYGVDGTTLRVADSAENALVFGRPKNGHGEAGYPKVRVLALMVLRSHVLAALSIGAYTQGEHTLAAPLWDSLPVHSLLIVDKGFIAYDLFYRIQSGTVPRHWLIRARKGLRWQVVESLGSDDHLVDLPFDSRQRRAHPQWPSVLRVRAIGYQRPGFRPQILLTSLLDPLAYPAAEIAALYHERWELELGFDETKTHTLERHETLRSQSPERVCQEIWGLAIGYNLVRVEIEHVARSIGLSPARISYRGALLLIRNFFLTSWLVSPGTLPTHLQRLHEELALLVLPKRRLRRYPRAVKFKSTAYSRKPRN